MRRWLVLILFLLALGTLRTVGCGDWFGEPIFGCGDCDDGNPCTRDGCAVGAWWQPTCVHDRVADGIGCSLDGRSGVCVSGQCDLCALVECPPDDNECTTEYCNRGECLSKPVTDGTACIFKGLFAGVCVSGFCGKDLCEDVVCDDGDACTVGSCDYVDGTCDFVPIVCDDSNPCTEDTCDPVDGCVFTAVEDGTGCDGRGDGMCEAGSCVTPCDLTSDEAYPCPILGLEGLFCCPGSEYCRGDCTVVDCWGPEDCDDQNECTEDRCSYEGICYFTPVTCNDYNPCTEDTCDPAEGCVFTAVEDETVCGSLAWCIAGECVPIECWSPEDCDDGNDCTEDMCSGAVCEYAQTDDGTPCAGGTCLGGACELTGFVLPCTEQGIRNAIAAGGGPYKFNCNGPTTIRTEAQIRIDNDVILDGEGNLTIHGRSGHRIFSVVPETTAELRGMTITHGWARYGGGGIHNDATLTLTNSTVSGNTTEIVGGGGIYNSGALTLTNSTVSGNTVADQSHGHGGGIYNRPTATLTLTNSTVSGNAAGSSAAGGGIRNSGALTLTNSTVSGNTAKYGGGISNRPAATLTLTNSTVSGNSAALGNAFYNGGVLTLTNSTVSGDTANHTAYTIYNSDALTVMNTVFDGDCNNQTDGTITSNGYNIESPGNTCGLDQPTDLFDVADLGLGPLQDNGGPTETHALLPGSDAIDRIPAAQCVDPDAAPLTTDQRGEPRPVAIWAPEPMCDVGAFEVQP